MASLIQRIAHQALQTFTKTQSTAAFREDLQQLRNLVHRMTAEDINLDPSLVANQEYYRDEVTETGDRIAPVTYLGLFEDHMITMGVFILKRGVKLPLHDHPGMHGVIKVIHGSAAIQSYSEAEGRAIPEAISERLSPRQIDHVTLKAVDRLPAAFVTQDSPPCLLNPDDGNFHEIHAPEGPMAFLDILAPPYDRETGARECNYYKALSLKSLLSNSQTNSHNHLEHSLPNSSVEGVASEQEDCYLVRIPQPREFWCDTAEYMGPEINPYINQP